MVNAQEWLDENYPQEGRNRTKVLSIDNKNLESNLDLNDFSELEELNCSQNQLTALKLDNCKKLKKLICDHNQLVQLDLANLNCLKELICWNNYLQVLKLPSQTDQLINIAMGENNLPSQDLSMFSHLTNLKSLGICNNNQEKINQGIYNRFHGSLETLKNLTELGTLNIENTDIDSGLEYLPKSVENFYCSVNKRKDAKCQSIYKLLESLEGESLSQKLKEYKQKIAQVRQLLKDEFQILSNLLFPDQPYDFSQLKQEITRLKLQELSPQAREEKTKFEQLITNAKEKAGEGSFAPIIDLLLETNRQINQVEPKSIELSKRTAKLEQKNGHEQKQINELKTKITQLEKNNHA